MNSSRQFKVYIPCKPWNDADTTILIGWIYKSTILITSYQRNPIELINNDNQRKHLLKQLVCINKTNNNFKCIIIGSTNIGEDCADLMRIFGSNVWLQFDKTFKLKQIISLNINDINDYYIIKYHPINLCNIFSPYYYNNSSSSYNQILNLCNQSVHIDKYLHSHHRRSNINSTSSSIWSVSIYLLGKYFQCISILYELFCALIVFIPPFFILSDCRIVKDLTISTKKFAKIIKYLNANTVNAFMYDNKQYNNNNCNNIHKKRKETLDIWSTILQHFINLMLGSIFAYFLYFYYNSRIYIKFFDYNSIKCDINYLMGIPIGLKLNSNLNFIFGKLSLLCLEILHIQIPYSLISLISLSDMDYKLDHNNFLNIWDVFDMNNNSKVQCDNKLGMQQSFSLINLIIIYLPLIKIHLCILSSLFGITFILSMLSDIISFLSLPFEILHKLFFIGYKFETKMLSICGKLFSGSKYNQLKHRVDKCLFDTDQLFIGIILFSIFTFILPTIVVYFIYFSVTMIYVWTFKLIMEIIQILIHYLSIPSLIFLLIKPKFICNGFDIYIQVEENARNVIELNTKSYGIMKYFKDLISNNIITNINKDIALKKFIYNLKINMY